MLMYSLDSLFFTRSQFTKMLVVFNNVFKRIFVCLQTHLNKNNIYFLGIKTSD